ncbi:hypothetical protein G6F22_002250 [Rhizopus arrhizus]|nr:hypothetical protein G6F22_002250 [Rhizopus arrhizus]
MTIASSKRQRKQLTKIAKPQRDHNRAMDKYTAKRDIIRKAIKRSAASVASNTKREVISILDFKVQSGQFVYLVQREGDQEALWENEASIEALDVLSAYQEKVHQQSGYSFQSRSLRASKARALMALKSADYVEILTYNDEDDHRSGTKRKTSSNDGGTGVKKGKSIGNRKTKAAVNLEAQMEERKVRRALREGISITEIMKQIESVDKKECCLMCAAGYYKECLEKDDLKEFVAAFDNTEHMPAPLNHDKYELGILSYSIVLGKEEFTKTIKEKMEEFHSKSVKRPEIPVRYIQYGAYTGRNYGRGAYGRMAFRQVQESRGNRQGDSAFYHGSNVMCQEYKLQLDIDFQLSREVIKGFMSHITKPVFQEMSTINSFKANIYDSSYPRCIYYTVEAGSRKLACELMQTDSFGRTTFNTLHVETLKFVDSQPLGSYRKPQILKNAFDAYGITPFHCAAINPSRAYLQEFYETLDAAERLTSDSFGRTVIFFAAASETSDCLEYLISQGVGVTQIDKYKMTPLMQAARFGRAHNVELIIKHLSEKKDTEDSSVIFQSLIRNKRTALHLAASFGHAETCRILIRYGCPVDAIESLDKRTALMYAAKNGHLECVRVLMEEGRADPEKGDKYSKNALHLACIDGRFDVVKYLLSQGVDADASDSSANRPSHYAAAFGHLSILHLLIGYGQANPGLSNVWRTTPCSIANVKGHVAIVKYLLDLPEHHINVNFKNEEGRSMLQHTVSESVSSKHDQELNLKKAKLLLHMNADVNSTDVIGDSCLHSLAKDTTYIKCLVSFYESFYPKKRRHTYGYDSNANKKTRAFENDDQDGIMYHKELAGMLIAYGADIDIQNQEGETPLASAMRSNNHSMVTFLIESGAKYWKDVDANGNNFIHYFSRFIAYIEQLQPHREMDCIQKNRLLAAADAMWEAIEKNQPANDDLKLIANTVNNEGYPPIVYGVSQAIRMQKASMVREKEMIRDMLGYTPPYSANYMQKHNVAEEAARNLPVNLTLSFDIWIKYMKLVLSKFSCNMDAVVALPKDYKKNNPKAKIYEYPEQTGYGAIHLAAHTQCFDLIQFLLQHGCDANLRVNIEGKLGNTPMTIAYHKKRDKSEELPNQRLETIEALKKKFTVTKPDFPAMLCKTIETLIQYHSCPYTAKTDHDSPIMKATFNMDIEILKSMCKATQSENAHINALNGLGQTPLLVAIDNISNHIKKKEAFDIEIVKLLLDTGADPNIQYGDGNTLFMKAISTSNALLAQTILEYSKVELQHHLKNKQCETALILSCSLNQEGIVDSYVKHLKATVYSCPLLLNTCDLQGNSPLSSAARNGNLIIVQDLLSLGADPNFCNYGVSSLAEAVKSKKIEVVQTLLDAGADVSYKTLEGNTALHIAVLTEKHQVVKLLLNYGANCNSVNNAQKTPLHFAIEATKKQNNRSFRVEKLLIHAGAHLNPKDNFGRTPLHYVFTKMDFVPLNRHTIIVAKKFCQISKELKSKKEIEHALDKFSNTYALDSNSCTDSWLIAGKKKHLEQKAIKEKKKHNPQEEIDMTNEEKERIKEYEGCIFEGELDIAERFDPIDIVKYLLNHEGIDCEAQDEFGRTPLHYAACVGAFSCTTMLIDRKVNINAMDADNNGALQLALQNGHVDYAVMLCNSGTSFKEKITLKNGKDMTTFGYSLSKSVINLAYLIMERGISLLESVRDILVNGKFHMVELLLQSVQNEALYDVLQDTNQNLWHVISDFTPFDSEIWHEYLHEIITRIAPLNLGIYPDKFMRTPLHYAAKHGQADLLKYMLESGKINLFDENGKSELYYAVESGDTESVKILINSGASICGQNKPKDDSMLLKAVKANHINIVRLLLEHNVDTDEDSHYNRPNAVMTACQNENIDILRLLIDAKANIDTPSMIERKDECGMKLISLVHPVFVASLKDDESIFKLLLRSGANPNVYGPNCYPEHGRSLFMFNVDNGKTQNQETLLEHKVDLNISDGPNNRSIFYQFLFAQLDEEELKGGEDRRIHNKKLKDSVFNKMIQEFEPQVSLVDVASGMTPLELAISKNNLVIAERLLLLNADPNIESCHTCPLPGFISFLNLPQTKIPSILHAILQNKLDMVMLICNKTQVPIRWLWHDREERNMLSYLFGCLNGYSSENTFMLEYLRNTMGNDAFRMALNMIDGQGNTPITYAYQRSNKQLFECLTQLEPTIKNITLEEDHTSHGTENMMEVDFISMHQIDEAAQLERELLQEEHDAKKKKDGIKEKVDMKAKVDPYSKLEKVGYVECDGADEPYDIMLLKVNINSWNEIESSAYKMSIIYNKVLDLYVLWTRWGAFGEEGQHQRTPYLTKEEAVAEFKSIFRSKTSNAWEDLSLFEAKPGKYDLLKESEHPKDMLLNDFDFMASSTPSYLPSGVLNAMKLICNYQYLSKVYKDTMIDMPLGQVPQKRIEEARQLLIEAKELNDKLKPNVS